MRLGATIFWLPLSLAQGSRHSLRGEMALSVPRATQLEPVERSRRGVVKEPFQREKVALICIVLSEDLTLLLP